MAIGISGIRQMVEDWIHRFGLVLHWVMEFSGWVSGTGRALRRNDGTISMTSRPQHRIETSFSNLVSVLVHQQAFHFPALSISASTVLFSTTTPASKRRQASHTKGVQAKRYHSTASMKVRNQGIEQVD